MSPTEIPSSPSITFPSIPSDFATVIKLPLGGSALSLAHIPVRPLTICGSSCCQPLLLTEEAPDDEDYTIMDSLRDIPCPTLGNLQRAYRECGTDNQHRFRSVRTEHAGSAVTLPIWALSFWKSVATYWDDIRWWHRASETLKTLECHHAHALLGTIPWSVPFPIPELRVRDLAKLATDSWLGDDQIDLLTWLVNRHLETSPVLLLQRKYPFKILDLYRNSRSDRSCENERFGWVNEPREQLRKGELDQIGFCLNVIAGEGMPDPGCPGNHWVAVILDRMSRSIWLGDSLGCRPDATLIEMLQWWLRPAFEESFKVRSLRFNKQIGSWSCGDRAVNMMANHFLPDEFPLIGGTDEDALRNRIELLVRLIGEIRTLVYPPPQTALHFY